MVQVLIVPYSVVQFVSAPYLPPEEQKVKGPLDTNHAAAAAGSPLVWSRFNHKMLWKCLITQGFKGFRPDFFSFTTGVGVSGM